MTLTDIEQLQRKAEELDGLPLPGIRMTEEEFETWIAREDVRAEWVDGEVILMSPANRQHLLLNIWLFQVVGLLATAHDLGEVQGIEGQVRLAKQRRRRHPDLLFVAKSRLRICRKTYVDGAPDLVIEIVSPDSESRDWRDKYLEYEAAGVREYWVIDLLSNRLEAYRLTRAKRYARILEEQGRVNSTVIKGLYLRPEWLWQFPPPPAPTILKELGVR